MNKANDVKILKVINKIKCRKVVGPDGLLMKVWKKLRTNGIFNFSTGWMTAKYQMFRDRYGAYL